MNTSNASLKTTKEWRDINWAKAQRKVFKLQKRIFQAVKSGQKAKARKLQKLLMKSHYAKLLAVRKVTQDNQGKKTAGVDGVKIVHDYQRMNLALSLKSEGYKSKALRRVWIPKPRRDEKRPLGIPTIRDRAMQALVKLALEPYWEAQFEGTSYGFRPSRSAHDAIERIYKAVRLGEKYVLDADIEKCFDKINHNYLLSKLDCPKGIRQLIKQWLKSGVLDNGVFDDTEAGTPQGGVISPLLANIALDGMIREVSQSFGKADRHLPRIIRYADDFVVIHNDLEVIHQCKKLISQWLEKVGLELKPEKTRICHTLKEIDIDGKTSKPGFDFLGFNIRSYPVGKHHSGKKTRYGELLGFKTLIKPSEKAIKAHREAIKEVIKTHRTAPQSALISRLNPIIRGWCNYYSTVASNDTFKTEDYIIWEMLRAWTGGRTGRVNYESLRKYFSNGIYGHWTFQTTDGLVLQKHAHTPIVRFTLVQPEASPYDGNWTYWSKRRGTYPDTPKRVSILIKRQKGYCNYCGQNFSPDDVVEMDHIIPESQGGKDEINNLQLLHRHCHDVKTRHDGSNNSNMTVPITRD